MKLRKSLSFKSNPRKLAAFSISSLSIIFWAFALVPELFSVSYAVDPAPTENVVSLNITPIDSVNKYNLEIFDPSSDGKFSTVGINASVTTANEYGYQLTMRSKNFSSRFVHTNAEFQTSSYISPIGSSIEVDLPNGKTFNEKNSYGWSTDWNPNTGKGIFNPLTNQDTVLKKSVTSVTNDSTEVYIGLLITDTLMSGMYDGSIIFTAAPNSSTGVTTTYSLNYNPNAVDVTSMPDSPVDKDIEEGYVGPVYFDIDTSTIPVRDGYTFVGWDIDKNSISPRFYYHDGVWESALSRTYDDSGVQRTVPILSVVSSITTLYAIWAQNFTLAFDANGGTGAPASITCSAVSYCDITIPSAQPTHPDGANFLGWSTSPSASSAELYRGNNVRIRSSAPTITLYAVYGIKTFDEVFRSYSLPQISGRYRLQDMTSTICNEITVGQTASLVDARDYQIYGVAKLNDGNCWMTENLRLGTTSNTSLESIHTDISGTFTLVAETTDGISNDRDLSNFTIVNGNYYYSYYTATAGGKGSICPKGWTIPPEGGNNGSVGNLLLAYGLVSSATDNPDPDSAYEVKNNNYLNPPMSFQETGYVYTGKNLKSPYLSAVYLWTSSSPYKSVNGGFTRTRNVVLPDSDYNGILALNGKILSEENAALPVRCVALNSDMSGGNTDPLGEDTIDLPSNVLYVVNLIKSLPDPKDITLADGELIERIRAAYEALTEEEKAMINESLVRKYNSVLAAYYSLVGAEENKNQLMIAASAGGLIAVSTATTLLVMKRRKEEQN